MVRSAIAAFNSFKEQALPIGPFLHGAEEPRPDRTQNYLGTGLAGKAGTDLGNFI